MFISTLSQIWWFPLFKIVGFPFSKIWWFPLFKIVCFSLSKILCFPLAASFISQHTWAFILSSYVYASIWAFTPVLGWGSYGVEPYGTSCTIQWNRSKGFVTLMLLLCILLPVVIMKCCYGSVYVYLRKNRKSFKQPRSRASSNIKKREGYLLKVWHK